MLRLEVIVSDEFGRLNYLEQVDGNAVEKYNEILEICGLSEKGHLIYSAALNRVAVVACHV